MEMAGDDMNKLATKMANEGLVASIEEGMADLASRAFWQAHVDAEFRISILLELDPKRLAELDLVHSLWEWFSILGTKGWRKLNAHVLPAQKRRLSVQRSAFVACKG